MLHRRHRSTFPGLWAWGLVFALLLKAATPLLATASAQLQGKNLVEVCTVYGVATVDLSDPTGKPKPMDDAGAHKSEHCTLTALAVMAAPDIHASFWPAALQAAGPAPRSAISRHVPDASAHWVAGLKHGPPALS